jgi:hypothetical protein
MDNNYANQISVKIAAYTWGGWDGFLFPAIIPSTIKIKSTIGESAFSIIDKIPQGTTHFLLHLNLTVTKNFISEREKLMESLANMDISVLNGDITDISKQFIQAALGRAGLNTTRARIEGDPDEMLIVKSNYNYKGKSESKLNDNERAVLQLLPYKNDLLSYKICKRRELNQLTWADTSLTVEKFITNQFDLFYRIYKLMGRLVVSEVIDRSEIKKMPEGIDRINAMFDLTADNIHDYKNTKYYSILQSVEAFSAFLAIDFAAIDIVRSDDGTSYIIDVNTTPFWGDGGHPALMKFLRGSF